MNYSHFVKHLKVLSLVVIVTLVLLPFLQAKADSSQTDDQETGTTTSFDNSQVQISDPSISPDNSQNFSNDNQNDDNGGDNNYGDDHNGDHCDNGNSHGEDWYFDNHNDHGHDDCDHHDHHDPRGGNGGQGGGNGGGGGGTTTPPTTGTTTPPTTGTTTPPTGGDNGGGGTGTTTPPTDGSGSGGGNGGTTTTVVGSGVGVFSGGGSVLSSNIIAGSGSQGQVLGASTGPDSTSCGIYIQGYIKPGANNNVGDVARLQIFLNTHEGANLKYTGIYDAASIAAVNAFQVKYSADILQPWFNLGLLPTPTTSTGYVYKTTRREINNLMCPSLDLPIPQIP